MQPRTRSTRSQMWGSYPNYFKQGLVELAIDQLRKAMRRRSEQIRAANCVQAPVLAAAK